MRTLIDRLIKRAQRTPYTHLRHGDGSAYMRRFWLMPRGMLNFIGLVHGDLSYELRADVRWLPAVRLHNIVTPDWDREMHNHPWSFTSIILRGGYVERRPVYEEPSFAMNGEEYSYDTVRRAGSVAFRRFSDRHRIVDVQPDTWTLIIQGPKRKGHTWGFFTEKGFVPWREFESVHQAAIR